MALFVVVPLVLAAGLYYGYQWWTIGRFQISTDDAYVHADIATLSSKVSGYVDSVDVADNSQVKAGGVVARIDDGDYAARRPDGEGQDRRAAGRHRSHRTPDRGTAGQYRAGAGAAWRDRSGRQTRQARTRPPEGPCHPRFLQPPDSGTGRGQQHARYRQCAERSGGDQCRRRQRRSAEGAKDRSGADARSIEDRAGHGGARPVLHHHPRARSMA